MFGAENTVHVGYGREDRENEEITLADSAVQTPFADLTYWLDVKNGFGLTYNYADARFSQENNLPTEDDYTGHSAGIQVPQTFPSPFDGLYRVHLYCD